MTARVVDAFERAHQSPAQPITTGLFAPEPTEAAFRATDPGTSMEAAKNASARVTRTRLAVLRAHVANPNGLTDYEASALAGDIGQSSAGKRRLELERLGFIERTGERRRSPSGNGRCGVWRVTAAGVAAFIETSAS